MRNNLIRLCLLSILLTFSFGTHAQLSSGLLAHWDFNTTANDVTGNGHNGTSFNTSNATGALGLSNTAYNFNGTNSYISVPYQSDLNVSNFTVTAIIKPLGYYTGLCEGNYVLARGAVGSSGGYGLQLYENAYNSCGTLDTSKEVFAAMAPVLTSATTNQYSPQTVSNNWYCVIASFDGSVAKVYINGVLKSITSATASSFGSSTSGLSIGAYAAGFPNYPYWVNGNIDDIRLYNRALSTSDVDSLCGMFNLVDTMVYIVGGIRSPICAGDTLKVTYDVTKNFQPGNVFTVQLSNAASSFASPVNIGTITANAGGSIICTIPVSTPTGTGYRIRIVGSNPVKTSNDNGVNITIVAKPVVTASTNSPICAGDTLKLMSTSAPAAGTYTWSGPLSYSATGQNQNITPATVNSSGIYKVITTLNGCKDSATATAVVSIRPSITLTGDTVVCQGKQLQISTTLTPAGSTCTWVGPSGFSSTTPNVTIPNVSAAQAGTYVITATYNGCTTKDSLRFYVIYTNMNFGNDTSVCNADSIILSAASIPGTYLWQDGSTKSTYTATQSGKYYVTVSTSSCTATDTINVNFIKLQLNLGSDTLICDNKPITLSAKDTYDTYKWNTGQTTSSIEAVSGRYWLMVSKGPCVARDTIDITAIDAAFDLGKDQIVCKGKIAELIPRSHPDSKYLWEDGTTVQIHRVNASGMYSVTVTNVCGVYKDSVYVSFIECDCEPLVPTAFTPNADGLNDMFYPKIKCDPQSYTFAVYNRWGQEVFKTNNKNEKWDGRLKGQPAEVGVYYYYIKMVSPEGNEVKAKGDVTLIR
ncbi:MAG: gliding motility-associated C-terminal domain-containing protein [Bacteroidetes bacterium]|nr:gliding motility-associated C-terminal domain-containing protein [Bacteroidota bacterium]